MKRLIIVLVMLALAVATTADAQRRFRVGPLGTSVSVENGSGDSRSYTGYGGLIALLTGDDNETGLAISRYGDLSDNTCVRRMTLFAINSVYYPVGAKGIAPFASTEIGLARVTESGINDLSTVCDVFTSVATSSQIGLGFGLGVRVGAGSNVVAAVEGRFLQVPNSFIQGLEARANVSIAFGSSRRSELLEGTLGPVVSAWAPLSGPLQARAPLLGVRFRRNTKKASVLGLQIDYAALRVTSGCTTGCEPTAILFAPGYEPSTYARWGRFYGTLGPLLVGFPSEGPDRGMAQGLQAGLGADIFSGRVMWNVNTRVLWLQRQGGENVFALQLGVGLSPRLARSQPDTGGSP